MTRKSVVFLVCLITLVTLLLPIAANAYERVARVKGVISAVDTVERLVKIKSISSVELTLKVVDNTIIIKNGQPSKLEALVVGDKAEVAFFIDKDGNKIAVRIAAFTDRPPVQYVKGVIVAKEQSPAVVSIRNGMGMIFKLGITSTTVIIKDGQPATYADLAVNDQAEAAYVKRADGALEAVRIAAWSPRPPTNCIKGTIVQKGESSIDVQPEGMLTVIYTFQVTSSTVIVKDGQPATFADLAVKDLVTVCYAIVDSKMVALKIAAFTPRPPVLYIRGLISAISLENRTVAIKTVATNTDQPEIEVVLTVGEKTLIYKNGVSASLESLAVGDQADASYSVLDDGTKLAIQIHARTPAPIVYSICGLITRIDPANKVITVAAGPLTSTSPTPVVDLKVTPETVIVKGGVKIGFEGLAVGDSVICKFIRTDAGAVALSIQVMPPILKGVIVGITPPGTTGPMMPTITVKTPDNIMVKVTVPNSCIIIKGGVIVPFSALEVGDFVAVDGERNFSGGITARRILALTAAVAL